MTAIAESFIVSMFPPRSDTDDYGRYPDPTYTSAGMDMSIAADAFMPRTSAQHQDFFPTSVSFEPSLYAEASHYMANHANGSGGSSRNHNHNNNHNHNHNNRASPSMYADDSDLRLGSSGLSTASVPSAASSAIGSPQSHHGQGGSSLLEWGASASMAMQPTIVGNDYMSGGEYATFGGGGVEDVSLDFTTSRKSFVDPSLIHPEVNLPPMTIHQHYDAHFQHPHQGYAAPSSVASSPQLNMLRNGSASPFLHTGPFQPATASASAAGAAGPIPAFTGSPYAATMDLNARRPSLGNFVSPVSATESYSGDEAKEKQKCTWPDCGRFYKDLKAHMLTHQNERPEKCPIQTCEYHTKGFARKYDKNRHTLTHYKGNMVCGFCPGSGSAAEKSFNRADVFKRHLTTVHGVEQTPPNSRKKGATAATGIAPGGQAMSYASDATGKCSTCSQTFANAQDFYEHLDDCVLRIVQQEDPAEAVNAQLLAEVENDSEVHRTLEKNNLPVTTQSTNGSVHEGDEDEDAEMDEDEDADADGDDTSRSTNSPLTKKKTNLAGRVEKSKGLTHSRGGVPTVPKSRGRKNRRNLPSSWGFDKGQMTMRKRVLAVFDGPRRLAKDEMVLSTEHEVRLNLSDPKVYVTDLDVQTLKRAEGFLNATDEEKGPWISDDPTEEQVEEARRILEAGTEGRLRELPDTE